MKHAFSFRIILYSSEFEPLPEDRLSELRRSVVFSVSPGKRCVSILRWSTNYSFQVLFKPSLNSQPNIPGYTAKEVEKSSYVNRQIYPK